MTGSALRGVCAAVVTPLDANMRPDASLAVPYYRSLLESGCDALNVLGTTGEAMSIAISDRLSFMGAVAAQLPRERLMVGTGASALSDAVLLTRQAFDVGFGAALVMPPFFFRGIADEGVMRYFELFFEAVHPPQGSIFLYNFPAMTGITFHPDLVDRLMESYPGLIGGMKDSSNDAALQREVAARHPELLMYPSSESFLSDARQRGFAGCISGTLALWPDLAAKVWRGAADLQPELTARRESTNGVPLIAAVRYALASRTGDARWERTLPPLVPLGTEAAAAFVSRLQEVTG